MTSPSALGRRVCSVLEDALPPGRAFALLDYPGHSNVGDSAIWLGELAALGRIGRGRPAYVSDVRGFSPDRLRAAVGDGPVLIHGGGNLGDLWPEHQLFRERVVEALPGNPIVQLPQSVEFRSEASLERARRSFDGHGALTLLVRDGRSLERARASFSARVELCPDAAFCLESVRRLRAPSESVLWLLRTDHEAAAGLTPTDGVRPVDWLDEETTRTLSRTRRLEARLGWGGLRGALARRRIERAWRALAEQRLSRGARMLATAEVVVTDRLHAHVLCLLMGIPHVVLPDRFGKVQAFLDTWTGGSSSVRSATSSADAARAAREMLDATRSGPERSE